MTFSDDGNYWWNGTEWIPADQAPAEAQAPAAAPAAAVDPMAAADPAAEMGAPVAAAAPAAAAAPMAMSADPRYNANELECKQRMRSILRFGQQYEIYTAGGEAPAGYAHRGFNFPFVGCDVAVYTDHTKSTELLRAKQTNGFDGWGTFDIIDSQTGETIAKYKRHFWAGILQRKWVVSKPDGSPYFMIQEDSLFKSLLRRVTPEIVHIVLRTNMNFRTLDGATDFGAFNRKFSLRDRYQIMRATPELDGRLLWITGPLLDSAGGR